MAKSRAFGSIPMIWPFLLGLLVSASRVYQVPPVESPPEACTDYATDTSSASVIQNYKRDTRNDSSMMRRVSAAEKRPHPQNLLWETSHIFLHVREALQHLPNLRAAATVHLLQAMSASPSTTSVILPAGANRSKLPAGANRSKGDHDRRTVPKSSLPEWQSSRLRSQLKLGVKPVSNPVRTTIAKNHPGDLFHNFCPLVPTSTT